MENKCSTCQQLKPLTEFHKNCCGKDGYRTTCKLCQNLKSKLYRENNKDKTKEYNKSYSKEHQDHLKKYREDYYKQYNKGGIYEERRVKSFVINKDKIRQRAKEYRDKNKESAKIYQRNYREKNRIKLNEYKLEYHKNNPHIKAWRTVLSNTLKRFNTIKESSTIELLGYSAMELRLHIERLFTAGMSWDNYGEWHIDHKKGVKSFTPDTPIHIVNALSNLQPLWAIDNLRKQ